MSRKLWSRWIGQLFGRRSGKPTRVSLRVEQLEAKVVPASAIPLGPQFTVSPTLAPPESPPAPSDPRCRPE